LGDYFSSCKEEVMNMSLTEFDQESFERQIRAEGISIGLEKGLAEGESKAKLEDAVIAVTKYNIPVEDVSKDFGIPAEQILKALR
ncbi:MAG: hypothetical protein KBT11_02700, partial [Treponema sp.]|nr:hypothetical protein [Candidatus Treponema equifaecale]